MLRHANFFGHDEAFAHERFDLARDGLDLVLAVDGLDENGQLVAAFPLIQFAAMLQSSNSVLES